jgi:hypothetical protein
LAASPASEILSLDTHRRLAYGALSVQVALGLRLPSPELVTKTELSTNVASHIVADESLSPWRDGRQFKRSYSKSTKSVMRRDYRSIDKRRILSGRSLAGRLCSDVL